MEDGPFAELRKERTQAGLDVLKNTKVRQIILENPKLITVQDSDSVSTALKLLIENKILGLPVYDSKLKKFASFLDVKDILCHAVKVLSKGELKQYSESKEYIDQISHYQKFSSATCGELVNASGRDVFIQVMEQANIETVISVMVDLGFLRRVPIVNQKDELVAVLSQSQLVKYLNQHMNSFGFATKTVGDITLGYNYDVWDPAILMLPSREVISATKTELVKDVLLRFQGHKFSALPIVDDNGVYIDSFSSSDFKIIGYNDNLFGQVLLTVDEFLDQLRKTNPKNAENYIITPDNTVAEVVQKFVDTKVHQFYVANYSRKLVGVISLIDIISLVFHVYIA